MSFRLYGRVALACAVISAVFFPRTAFGQDSATPTAIVPAPKAPIEVTSCKMGKAGAGYKNEWTGSIVIGNRTSHAMATSSVTFIALDSENTRMDQRTKVVTYGAPVASADTAATPIFVDFEIPGREALLDHIACRVEAATFSANKRWTSGTLWTEKLVALQSDNLHFDAAPSAVSTKAAAPRMTISVVNSWNDSVGGTLLVHDTIAITGGSVDTKIQASDLTLTMTLAGGAKKSYGGLAAPAPTYQKINPLGSQTQTAYEVQPGSDLGRLGAIVIPAHGAATATVTFVINDVVATPSDNRTVSLR